MTNVLNHTAYSSGQSPTVGDIVKVSKLHKFDYYSSMRYACIQDTKFRVVDIKQGIKSVLIKVELVYPPSIKDRVIDTVNYMSVSNFYLHKGVDVSPGSKARNNFIVVRNGKIVAVFDFESSVEDFVKKSVQKDFTYDEFVVYERKYSMKTETPKIVKE